MSQAQKHFDAESQGSLLRGFEAFARGHALAKSRAWSSFSHTSASLCFVPCPSVLLKGHLYVHILWESCKMQALTQ